MSLYNQPKNLFNVVDTTATGSGIVNKTFMIPADAQGIVVRIWTGTLTTVTADVYVQTSEDGGTTWRDCAHAVQFTAAVPLANAHFLPIPTMSGIGGVDPTAFVGSVQASTLAAGRLSGLPLMGTIGRISIKYGGGAGTNGGVNVDVFATGQDAAI